MCSHGNQCSHGIGRQAHLATSPCFTSQGSHCSLCGSVLAHAWPWAGCAWLPSVLPVHITHTHSFFNPYEICVQKWDYGFKWGGLIWLNIKHFYVLKDVNPNHTYISWQPLWYDRIWYWVCLWGKHKSYIYKTYKSYIFHNKKASFFHESKCSWTLPLFHEYVLYVVNRKLATADSQDTNIFLKVCICYIYYY